MLKKLIKELPSLVPADEQREQTRNLVLEGMDLLPPEEDSSHLAIQSSRSSVLPSKSPKQQHGDRTTECQDAAAIDRLAPMTASSQEISNTTSHRAPSPGNMTKSPGEVAFFKMLHSELKKASHFFDRATAEFLIREERVREGMSIMKQPNSILVNDKWSLMATSIYRLYKDLLLLETYAIMSYCSFSKILKKHDKMTGYSTRGAFMMNMVNKQNFTSYPEVMGMILRCESLYEEVSKLLSNAGNEGFLEDERLFINMIHRLNEQVLSTDKEEARGSRLGSIKRPAQLMPSSTNESRATSAVRSLVEEINESKSRVDPNDMGSDDDCDRKRPAPLSLPAAPSSKKQRAS
jgi:hypothetical protein